MITTVHLVITPEQATVLAEIAANGTLSALIVRYQQEQRTANPHRTAEPTNILHGPWQTPAANAG